MLRPTLHTRLRFCPPFLYKAFSCRDEEAAGPIGWALYPQDDDDSEANTRTPFCWPPSAQGLLEQDWCKSTPAAFIFVLVQFLHQLIASELLKNLALPYTGWFRRKGQYFVKWAVSSPVKQIPSYRTRSATLPLSEPLPTTTGHYTIIILLLVFSHWAGLGRDQSSVRWLV